MAGTGRLITMTTTPSTGDSTRRYFSRRIKAAPAGVWARPNALLRGSIAWLTERNVPAQTVCSLIGVQPTSYRRWKNESTWPSHGRGYALCLLVRALKARDWRRQGPAEFLSTYAAFARWRHESFVTRWPWVIEDLCSRGYRLTEIAETTGASKGALTYMRRGATYPHFGIGELMLDMRARANVGDPTLRLPASAHPGRMPDPNGYPPRPSGGYEVLCPLISLVPGSTRPVAEPEDL